MPLGGRPPTSPPRSPTRPAGSGAALAPAGGSLIQLFLATVPLLAVLVYFLIAAARRPYLEEYTADDDYYLSELLADRAPIIGLTPMLYTFLSVFACWSCLAMYLLLFVPKRRSLTEKYASSYVTVRGNVRYRPKTCPRYAACCGRFRPETAVVTYAHPDPESVNRRMGTTYDDDGPARRRDWIVSRRVTTYKPYSRESVPIVLLKDMPLSGQSRDDVEVDVATYRRSESMSRDRIRRACGWVIVPWIAFSFFGALFVVTRMGKIDDEYDDPARGWRVFLIGVLGVTPALAVGGNLLRWWQYKNYKCNSGRVMEGDRNRRLPEPEEEALERECGGIAMSAVCGAPSDRELGISGSGSDDASSYLSFQ